MGIRDQFMDDYQFEARVPPSFQFSHPALVGKENELTGAENGNGWGLLNSFVQSAGFEGHDLEASRTGLNQLKSFVAVNPDLENVIGDIIGDKDLYTTITDANNSQWLQAQLTSLVPQGAAGAEDSDIYKSVRTDVVAYLEKQAANPAFRAQLQEAIITKNEGFFDDVYTSVTSVAIDAGLETIAEKGPQHANLVETIQANPSLTAAIDNLAASNTGKFNSLIQSFGGGDDVDPDDAEAVAAQTADLESAQTMLENPVLAGQMTQIINNMADPSQNITPDDLTALRVAAKTLQSAAEEAGIGIVFGNEDYEAAKIGLETAYVNVGLTERDANLAIEQGAIMAINERLAGWDNFGNGMAASIAGMLSAFLSEEDLASLQSTLEEFFDFANFEILGESLRVNGLSAGTLSDILPDDISEALPDWLDKTSAESLVGIDTSERPAEPASTEGNNETPDETVVDEVDPALISEADVAAEALEEHASLETNGSLEFSGGDVELASVENLDVVGIPAAHVIPGSNPAFNPTAYTV